MPIKSICLRICALFGLFLGSPLLAQQDAGDAPSAVSLAAAGDRFLEDGNSSLRYREIGSGEPVILLHGFALSSDTQTFLANALAADRRVIAMDFRGFGKSSKSGDPADFGATMAEDVLRLMDHLDLEKAHVAGHSMGALVAAYLAAHHPERLASVTIIAGPFYDLSAAAELQMADDLSAGKGMVGFIEFASPGIPPNVAKTVSDQIVGQNDVPSMVAVLRALEQVRGVTSGPVPSIPALIICGDADPLLPVNQRLAEWWTGSELVVVPGANHNGILASDLVVSAMLEREGG